MPPFFLNVDLEVEASKAKLGLLVAELGERVFVLHLGPTARRNRCLLSLESSTQHKTPDDTIRSLCNLVESLSAGARAVWSGAFRKEFDVGYRVPPSDSWSHFALRADTLQRVANLSATLAVSCYHDEGARPEAPSHPRQRHQS